MARKQVVATMGVGAVSVAGTLSPSSQGAGGSHAYFNALVARSDHWKSFSLRDDTQLSTYRQDSGLPASVTYDATMDAAKAVVPEYWTQVHATLTAGASSSDTTLNIVVLVGTGGVFNVTNRFIKVGTEVVQLAASNPHPTASTIVVVRGKRGTTAVSHASGEEVHIGSQSLENQVRIPLGTSDGHRYFFVWDSYWHDDYRLPISAVDHYKMNQLESGGTIWFEPRIRIDGGQGQASSDPAFDNTLHNGVLDFRSYNQLNGPATWDAAHQDYFGPIVTNKAPVEPLVGTFIVFPGRWTRHFVLLDQRANDYDYVTCWAADTVQAPVKLLDAIPLSVRTTGGTPNAINHWRIELNTSLDNFLWQGFTRQVGTVLQSWWRNFVVLQDPPADVTSLLQQPT